MNVGDPTSLQRRASDPSSSAWVGASAGSGKTKVLTDRVLRLLLAGASPSRILCITYTKAASAEMQNRIHGRLGQWVTMEEAKLKSALTELIGYPPAEEVLRLARRLFALLLEDAPGLRIQTFHSFCQSLLARFPLEAGVAPHFMLVEERDARDLLEEARRRLLQSALMRGDLRLSDAVAELIAELGEKGFDEVLGEIVSRRRDVERVLLARGWAVAHNTRLYEALGLPFYGVSEEQLLRSILPMDELRRAKLRQAVEALRDGLGGKTDAHKAELLDGYLREGNVQALMEAFLKADGELPRDNKQMGAKLQAKYPQMHTFLQTLAQECQVAGERLAALGIARFSDAVVIVAEALFSLYGAMKRARGYLDYDDLILKARALLREEGMTPWVLYKIDGGIDHLLIDEAQDTSPEQWELKEVLEDEFFAGKGAREESRTLFVVGDEKQSIYRFQGADPGGFAQQKERTRRLTCESGAPFEEVPMRTSFRTVPAVLEAVDAVFTAGQGHIAHRAQEAGRVTLWPLEGGGEEGQAEPWPLPGAYERAPAPSLRLARRIADTVVARVKDGRWRAGDVLVLVRSRDSFIHYLSRALKDCGVAVAGLDRMKLTEHLAVRDLMALAQFLLLPEDDYTLACLLKSPLYGISEETLFALCHARQRSSLWERLRGNGDCASARAELEALLAQADWGSPHALFVYLLYGRGGRERFAARMGREVEEVLDVFLSLAIDYERLHPPTLQGFLAWLAHGGGEIKRDMEQEADAVRIMTVHGAKGLEAPVVFLVDKTSPRHLRDRLYFLPREDGELLLCSPRSEADDALVARLREERKTEDAQESLRLFYVAMTRARDELFIAGWKGEKAVPEECWHSLAEAALQRIDGIRETQEGGLLLERSGNAPLRSGVVPVRQTPPPPAFVRSIPVQEAPREVLLAPSYLDETAGQEKRADPTLRIAQDSIRRGVLIHRLLHVLSAVPRQERGRVGEGYLQRHAPPMTQDARSALLKEVLNVMHHPDFSEVFAPDALAEAPVIGTVDGRRIFGQIDRLSVTPGTVSMVDFKTGMVPDNNDIPDGYMRQLAAYRSLLTLLYPGREIRAALLYTAGPTLVPIA